VAAHQPGSQLIAWRLLERETARPLGRNLDSHDRTLRLDPNVLPSLLASDDAPPRLLVESLVDDRSELWLAEVRAD
jgi:hypothetical protein